MRKLLACFWALLVSTAAHADTLNPTAHPYHVGVYEGAGCDGVTATTSYTKWSGSVPARALDFLDDSTWTNMVSEADWMLGCWPKPVDLIISVPMLPADGVSTLALGAAGNYDTYFTQLAQKFVKAGRGNAVIRLGWEFNGGWFAWSAYKDPASFIAFWQRIVTAMRGVPGAHFEFDWCSSWGWASGKTDAYYPGDAYVDIVGMDVYNQWWNAQDQDPQTRWNDFVNEQYGLGWQQWFAQQHHKMRSFPEWGTGSRPDGHGGGDDPLFVANMLHWMFAKTPAGQQDVEYADYWDYPASDYNAKLSDNHQPQAGYAYLSYFNWNAADVAAAKVLAAAKNAAAKAK